MARKLDKRLLEWEREPDGICVVTAYGWAFEPAAHHDDAAHVHIYPTAKEARAAIKWIEPCECLRCTSRGTKA